MGQQLDVNLGQYTSEWTVSYENNLFWETCKYSSKYVLYFHSQHIDIARGFRVDEMSLPNNNPKQCLVKKQHFFLNSNTPAEGPYFSVPRASV